MANLIKKFSNDAKLPSKKAVVNSATPAVAGKASAPAKKTAAPKKTPATKVKADDSGMVKLLLPEGTAEFEHKTAKGVYWLKTPTIGKYPRWFRSDKYTYAVDPKTKRFLVTATRKDVTSRTPELAQYIQS